MVAKLALTRAEIQSLPDNYDAARSKYSLPDLFGKNSAWIEIEWFPGRTHDSVSNYSPLHARVPQARSATSGQAEIPRFSSDPQQDMSAKLDGVALVMQSILVDSRGKLAPTRLYSRRSTSPLQEIRSRSLPGSRNPRLRTEPQADADRAGNRWTRLRR